jgi:Uma2 family endonuclease
MAKVEELEAEDRYIPWQETLPENMNIEAFEEWLKNPRYRGRVFELINGYVTEKTWSPMRDRIIGNLANALAAHTQSEAVLTIQGQVYNPLAFNEREALKLLPNGVEMDADEYFCASPITHIRHEIIDGRFFKQLDSHQQQHQLIHIGLVQTLLETGLAENERAFWPSEFYVDQNHVLWPDGIYIRADSQVIDDDHYRRNLPEFICEIIAPSTEERDWGIKRELYARFGVEEYWIITPDGTLTIHHLKDGQLQSGTRHSGNDVFRSVALDNKLIEIGKIFRHVGY